MKAAYEFVAGQLEPLLSPRVVARSLHEGLAQLGKAPGSASREDLEKVLKSTVYRQLQVVMPADQARHKISEVLAGLRDLYAQGPPQADALAQQLARQQALLTELKGASKPFNLYFEWPETQALRAQLQRLDRAQEAGQLAPELLDSAQKGLRSLARKLEDGLVLQADALNELQEAFATLRPSGGPELRRLQNLVGLVRSAQGDRQLAGAEVAQAKDLIADLRERIASSESAASARKEGVIDGPFTSTSKPDANRNA